MATDPPYLVDYSGGNHPASRSNRGDPNRDKHWDEYHDPESSVDFYFKFLSAGLAHLVSHSPIYQWHAHRRQASRRGGLDESGIVGPPADHLGQGPQPSSLTPSSSGSTSPVSSAGYRATCQNVSLRAMSPPSGTSTSASSRWGSIQPRNRSSCSCAPSSTTPSRARSSMSRSRARAPRSSPPSAPAASASRSSRNPPISTWPSPAGRRLPAARPPGSTFRTENNKC